MNTVLKLLRKFTEHRSSQNTKGMSYVCIGYSIRTFTLEQEEITSEREHYVAYETARSKRNLKWMDPEEERDKTSDRLSVRKWQGA